MHSMVPLYIICMHTYYMYTYLLYYYKRVRLLNLLRFVNAVHIRQRVGHTSWYVRFFPQIK